MGVLENAQQAVAVRQVHRLAQHRGGAFLAATVEGEGAQAEDLDLAAGLARTTRASSPARVSGARAPRQSWAAIAA